MNYTFFRTLSWNLTLLIAAFIGSFIAITPIVGSSFSFFRVNAMVLPLSGMFGMMTMVLTVGCALVSKLNIFSFGNIIMFLVYHIPSFCGALYFASVVSHHNVLKKLLFCLIPLACMLLFIAHPVGSHVPYYSFFWLIPVITALISHNSFLLHALGSTFTSHAVGTILWLYTHTTTVQFWHMLMPIVPFERIVLATGMTLLYYGLSYGMNKLSIVIPVKNLCK